MDMNWKKLGQDEQKVGYKVVIEKHFKMPDGKVSDWTTWGSTDTHNAGVIALTPDKQVVIARQFRPGPERILEEIPGGGVDEGETAEQAAARELLEETGYASDEPLEFLGNGCRDAYKNEIDNYYIAYNCTKRADSQLGADEFIVVDTIPISKFIANAQTGMMSDAIAVLMAYEKLKALQAAA